MKKIISKWLVGICAFALCMFVYTNIVNAVEITANATRVTEGDYFLITVKTEPGEKFTGLEADNLGAQIDLKTQQGNIRVYQVSMVDSPEMIGYLNFTLKGYEDTPDKTIAVQTYYKDATDEELQEFFGDTWRGDGHSLDDAGPANQPRDRGGEGGEDGEGGEGGEDGGELSGTYGDPEDLAAVLSVNGGVGEVVFDFLKLIAIILTFGCLCFLGVNLMINREKAEDRASTMMGLKYIMIGVLLLDVVLLIYAMVDGLMGNQEDEIAEFNPTAHVEVIDVENI